MKTIDLIFARLCDLCVLAFYPPAARAQIESTDREIDALVYALYGLTDEEIGIVEG